MKLRYPSYALPILAFLLIVLATPAVWAQVTARLSPHSATSAVIDGSRVSIFYGRPYMTHPRTGEARTIWGGLVPFDRVWRMGANEATLLTTQESIAIGDTTIPAGAHTLFLLPKEDGSAVLIINKQIGQWGNQYDESQDLARVDLTAENLETAVEQFTISVERGGEENTGTIKMMWDRKQYSVGFKKAE